MKTKTTKTFAAIIILAATMAMSSCQKEKLNSKNNIPDNTPRNTVKVTDPFNDIQNIILFEVTKNLSFKTETCEIITDDTISVPHILTTDYGTGCVDAEGRTRKGQMIITYDTSDFMHVTGANSFTTFSNFSIDDNQVTGTFNIHNDGINGNSNYSYTVVAKYDQILPNNGGTKSAIGQQVIEWVGGQDTPDNSDNQFSYTGGIVTLEANGDTTNATILQPLIEKRAQGCEKFFVSGQTLTKRTGQSDKYLDFGDGTCDNLAVQTIDGVSTTVTLQ